MKAINEKISFMKGDSIKKKWSIIDSQRKIYKEMRTDLIMWELFTGNRWFLWAKLKSLRIFPRSKRYESSRKCGKIMQMSHEIIFPVRLSNNDWISFGLNEVFFFLLRPLKLSHSWHQYKLHLTAPVFST